MSLPFSEPRALIENAVYHIQRVEAEFEVYRTAHPMNAHQKPGGEPNTVGVKFVPSADLPIKIRLATKDAIHNMRSALDIMAVEVVRLSQGNPNGVYFPFARDADDLEEAIRNKNFNRAKPEAVDLLRSMKPFTSGNKLLRGLHDLDVPNKHKFIVATSLGGYIEEMYLGSNHFMRFSLSGNLGDDLTFPIGMPVIIPGPVLPVLAFAPNQPFENKSVIETLHHLHETADGVVEAFATLFAI